MKSRSFLIFFSLFFLACLASLTFSRNGIIDLYRLHDQMNRTRRHISKIEDSNRELRRKIDLIRKKDAAAFDYRIRVQLGLMKEGELLYIEPEARLQN